ncbi:Amino acid transporter [Halopelagius inordinatus]|uniref:Amino acid transporter n=1 Tax=Halopelagius inordinatus TaxID=553467 RepID=A0A1I2PCZ2_9EURY|nr:APC family permease [Halopelagius inordinatus]SFG11321.1 Amino acid transporter [Halopelagius inordinatus]
MAGVSDETGGGSDQTANRDGETPVVERPETADEATVHDEGTELERTIGVTGGIAIGVGTMVGAGIFVFPGIAAGQAGPAAAGSFAIGAVIALLVALPASELATAMPRSGGGYYFISRGIGSLFGAIVGLSLWFGLVFASAFYLVGFGFYAEAVLARAGVSFGGFDVVVPLALLFGVFLTALNVTGTENAAKLQNGVVAILLAIIVGFLTFGGLSALGVVGDPEPIGEPFLSQGVVSVLTTAALVFTSYLGFAQVATVAGEIKQPGKNLPLAMVGSVLIVGVLYVATIFVATSAFGSERLASLGETAMVTVAESFMGPLGAFLILIGGLLATVSSANASILSTSRAIYAVSKDALLPRAASRINLTYGTPHVALGMAGGPILALVLLGEVDVLAEVASFLHLVMYGLMCVALIALRRDEPEWYDPDFRVPGYPVVPVLGALASFALIGFMQRTSQLIGLAIMLVSAGWYLYYARDVKLKGVL